VDIKGRCGAPEGSGILSGTDNAKYRQDENVAAKALENAAIADGNSRKSASVDNRREVVDAFGFVMAMHVHWLEDGTKSLEVVSCICSVYCLYLQ
jgi:hypothetical protein